MKNCQRMVSKNLKKVRLIKMTTFKDIYEWLEYKSRPLIIPTQFIPEVPNWYTDLDFLTIGQNSLDRLYLTVKYPDSISAFDTDLLDITISGILKKNEYRFNNLYKTIIQNYNIIENYNRYEDTTLDVDGSNSNNTKAESKNIRTGSEIDTKSGSFSNSKGGTMMETTAFAGSEKHTQNGTMTSTNQSRAFNSGLTDVSKNTSTTPSGTDDTLSFADRKNTTETTFNKYIDTTEYNALKNQHSYDSVTDSCTDSSIVSGVRKDKHTTVSHIHGNIGVTTSAQMLDSERKLSKFDFIDIVYTTIINELSCGFVDPEVGYYDD